MLCIIFIKFAYIVVLYFSISAIDMANDANEI